MRWLFYHLWHRPVTSYRLDRSFGWSVFRAILRAPWPGRKYVYPPHVRAFAEGRNQTKASSMVYRQSEDKR